MSDLRVILAVAGAVLVVLILLWYKWQERRLRKRGDAAFGSRHEDVLLSAARRPLTAPPAVRVEPVIGHNDGARPAEESPAEIIAVPPAAITPTQPAPVVEPVAEVEPEPRTESALPVDGRIDAVAVLTAGSAAGIDATPLLSTDWSKFSKTVNRFGEQGGAWSELAAGQTCQRVAIAMQLVDRKGPVPGMEFATFTSLLEGLATQHGWQLELGSSESVLRQAAELDRLCMEVDFQIAFDVVAATDKPFSGTRIRGIAEANGLELAPDGAFSRSGPGGNVWFTLKNRGATPFSPEHMRDFSSRALTLVLDVPRVPRDAFPALRVLLNALCTALQGTVVDEQGRRLDDAALDLVADQLRAIQGRLEQNGITPGGAVALRLFS
jgi:ZipA, C-terminal FtsZ-binding domain